MENLDLIKKLNTVRKKVSTEIGHVIIGQQDILDHLFIAMLCQGHVLLEGVPGLAKTMIIKTFAQVPVHSRSHAVRYNRHRNYS